MKKTVTVMAWLLAICLMPFHAFAATAPAAAVTRAIEIISYFESSGDYGSAHNDTNGLPSLGFIQWNGNETMELLNRIIDEDKSAAQEILGEAFFAKVYGKTSWKGTMTKAELSAASKLLKTDRGVAVQNALSKKYVAMYIEKGMELGISDVNALCYYADMRHQVGSGAIVKYQQLAAEKAGGYEKIALKDLYDAALKYATHTAARRKKAYQMLLDKPVSGEPQDEPIQVKPTKVSLGSGVLTLKMNGTLKLSPALTPENARTTFIWRTTSRKIARVADGVITPVKPGNVTIRVRTANGLTASVKVRVAAVAVDSIKLTGDAAMKKGDIQTLAVSLFPQDATERAVRFKSSNTKIAVVSKKGAVKALRKGTVTIYCQSRDKGKATAKFQITVK